MKGMLIGCAGIILVLLTGAILLNQVVSHIQCVVGESAITAATPVQAYRMVIWAEWIRLPRRQRRYYNPLRRYRLTKKQRGRVRKRLGRIQERQVHPASGRENSKPPERVGACPGRWS